MSLKPIRTESVISYFTVTIITVVVVLCLSFVFYAAYRYIAN